jgi:integrase
LLVGHDNELDVLVRVKAPHPPSDLPKRQPLNLSLVIDRSGSMRGQVRNLRPGDDLVIKEKKTAKERRITLNGVAVASIRALLASRAYHDDAPLFASKKGGNALTVQSVNRLVKSWCQQINLNGNYGSHTLRKTFGYMQRTQ